MPLKQFHRLLGTDAQHISSDDISARSTPRNALPTDARNAIHDVATVIAEMA